MNAKCKTAAKSAAKTCKKACAKAKACAPKAQKPVAKPVTFTVRADKDSEVYLAGCFNGWDPAAKKMTGKKDGVYSATVKLAPGTYQYKFVVNGAWQADPENADWVANDMGTINSVVTVK